MGQEDETAGPGPVIRVGGANPRTLDLYEDPRCSYCARVEQQLGPTVTRLAAEGLFDVAYHIAIFLDRGDEQGGSTSAAAALAAAAAVGTDRFEALRTALFEYRLEHGGDGFADPDVLRGIAVQAVGTDFPAVGRAIDEDRYRPWALEAGPAALASLRAAWAAAELPGKAGTPAAFLGGRPVEVLTADGDPLSPEEFEANVRAALTGSAA
jgi:hypothetical protein